MAQDMISTTMARHLGSLTSHYGQTSTVLQESKAGEAFSQEDLRGKSSISLIPVVGHASKLPLDLYRVTL